MNDSRNPTTIEQLLQKYNLSDIGKTKKAVELQKEQIVQVNNEQQNIINSIIINLADLLENQSDISLWFFSGVPTLDNNPASDWTTDELKDNHLGDFYFNKDTGYVYQFELNDTTYEWVQNTDVDLVQAMALTNASLLEGDNERKVFFDTPTLPIDSGDWWVKTEGLYISQVTKEEGTLDDDDFIIASKYVIGTQAIETNEKITVLSGQVTTIEQDVDSITQTVTTTTTVQNNMLSDMNALRETLSTISSTILTQTENSFQVWLEQTGLLNTLNELGELVEGQAGQLETISTYFRFTLAGLEIGKSGDQVKLLVSNNKISFMTGSSESAYITENKLYITDSTIITRLQLGQFVTEIDSLGNANKRWVDN